MSRPARSSPFSNRTGVDRSPSAWARRLAAARRRGLLDLTVSNPTRVGLADGPDLAAALRDLDPGALAVYDPDPRGDRRARAAIAADLAALDRRPAPSPDDLVITASTSEAYALLFQVLADPGDLVLVPRPSYPLFEHLVRFGGLGLRTYDLLWDGDRSCVDPESLTRAAADPRVRAVVAVSPNNPTGSYLSPEDAKRLAALGRPLLVDEVFRHHPVQRPTLPPRAADVLGTEALVFSLGGASKHLGRPQVKIAWVEVGGPEGPRVEALERLELVADALLDVAPPLAAALPRLLAAGAPARAEIRARAKVNADTATRLLTGSPASVEGPPEGGWSLVLRVPRTRPDEAWAETLLDEEDVVVQPGWLYDYPDEGRLVVSLLTPPGTFAEGLRRLDARVRGAGSSGALRR